MAEILLSNGAMRELTQTINRPYDEGMACDEIAKFLGLTEVWEVYSTLLSSDTYHEMQRVFVPDEVMGEA